MNQRKPLRSAALAHAVLLDKIRQCQDATRLADVASSASERAENLERESANLRHVAELALERMNALQEDGR